MRKRPAVFVDRDGTLIHEAHYLSDPRKARLFAGAARAVRRLNDAGFLVFMITNQSGVARGYFTEADVRRVNRRVTQLLRRGGARIDGVFYCPHHREGSVARYRRACACRKPRPGMVRRAARRFPIDRRRSFVLGDHLGDMQLAVTAGLGGAVFLTTGHGKREWGKVVRAGLKVPKARDIAQAVGIVLRRSRAS